MLNVLKNVSAVSEHFTKNHILFTNENVEIFRFRTLLLLSNVPSLHFRSSGFSCYNSCVTTHESVFAHHSFALHVIVLILHVTVPTLYFMVPALPVILQALPGTVPALHLLTQSLQSRNCNMSIRNYEMQSQSHETQSRKCDMQSLYHDM